MATTKSGAKLLFKVGHWVQSIFHFNKRSDMDITVNELKERQTAGDDNFTLLDVRENYERAEFNIGGVHIPLGDVPARYGELSDKKDEEIIVYCRSGKRSANAVAFLNQLGFSNVRNLTGGMLAWQG